MRADVRVLMRNFNTLLFVAEHFTHVSGRLIRTAALTLAAFIKSKDFYFFILHLCFRCHLSLLTGFYFISPNLQYFLHRLSLLAAYHF